jgi:hypothetical protein
MRSSLDLRSCLWLLVGYVAKCEAIDSNDVDQGYYAGPAAWVLVAEIYPISVRGPGMSVAASSNWVRIV